MPIGDEKVAVVVVLHRDPVLQNSEVVYEVQFAGGAHAADDSHDDGILPSFFWAIISDVDFSVV
jgi:hypothetical protein